MSKNNLCFLTNDVETHSIWFNCLRDETGVNVLKEGMPRLLEIYSKYNIQSTFFFTGYIAKKFPNVVKMIQPYGHEVGSHGYSHEVDQAFDVLSYKKQVEHLRLSKKILEDISGEEVISFRAPALRINSETGCALAETGFKIDSSVASQRFDMFMSFGGSKKLNWLVAPRLPYRTKPDNLFRKGNGQIIEIPLSATLLPYLGTTMRIFPKMTKIQHSILNLENRFNSKPIVFLIHPNELIDESSVSRVIKSRSSNYLQFLLKDLLRSKLKVRNIGIPALNLFEREIFYFNSKNYQFTTIKNYVIQTFK